MEYKPHEGGPFSLIDSWITLGLGGVVVGVVLIVYLLSDASLEPIVPGPQVLPASSRR